MSTSVYIALSAMMFLEYAVWGAWAPVLAARLLGPLKMTGKQTGWIYATLPLASMFSPLLAGQVADKWVDTGWVLAAAHLLGAVLMFVAVKMEKFNRLFIVMLLYSMCYGATIPLVNSLMFRHLTDAAAQSPAIFIWAPVAWSLIGWLLTGMRQLNKKEADGRDCLILSGVLSVLMAVVCMLQPATPPLGKGGVPMFEALGMLKEFDFLVFILVSLFVAGMMQFYFLGTARFMQDIGVAGKNVPASMAIAQAAQAIATWFALGLLTQVLGYKWTLTIGAASWLVMYIAYAVTKDKWLIVGTQVFHGLAYVFFIIAGQLYVNEVAPKTIAGSAQALIILVTTGIGLFLGTQLAGIVMDRFCVDGKFDWRKVWMVPGAIILVGVLALAVMFRGTVPEQPAAEKTAPTAESTAK